ncbi:multidrug effflux MFS transporter [Rhizobium sp. CSW-27]|uniref:multidrug effflux MFS transporter n=1 Tax=Rhizobium sp. CSW-27 TaxID=2839985 RepID=UPI001C01EF2E|nr:multidrug effflux MFS transporter [Rhizobium sp. CSW-27]MBT9370680.1 multidrug effflux MFS transporter [Rhizobium sp. CSW-27]
MSEGRTTFLGALLTTLGPISMAIYTPAMPELVHAFGTTEAAVKMSLSMFFGGFALAQLMAGPLSDALGRKVATLAFLAIYLLGSAMAALAPSVEIILAARLIQGIGASVGVVVGRAIVRDLYVGPEAARILNTIGIFLAVGPAMGPTLGGLTLAAFSWHAVFLLMVGFGLLAAASTIFLMRETIIPDVRRLKPARLMRAYAEVAQNRQFLASAVVLSGSIGALYAQSTMLPFVLINRVGLTPTAFGIGMLMQSGFYLLGSLTLKMVAARISGQRAAEIGITLCGLGGVIMALSVAFVPPFFLSIMGPVAICTFGIAFLTPHVVTQSLAPFAHVAGSASALTGFLQMGCGFLGGVAAAAIGDPLTAFGIIIPGMELAAVAGFLWLQHLSRRA